MKPLLPLTILLLAICGQALAQVDALKARRAANGTITFQRFDVNINPVPTQQAYVFLQNKLHIQPGDSLHLDREITDDNGITHKSYSQYYKGIKVEYASYKLHIKNGFIEAMSGNFAPVGNVPLHAAVTRQQALNNAVAYAKSRQPQTAAAKTPGSNATAVFAAQPQVIFYDAAATKQYRLAYKLDVSTNHPYTHNYVFVDAANGKILGKQNLVFNDNSKGSGATMYSGTRNFITDSYLNNSQKNYRLREVTNGVTLQTLNLQHKTDGLPTDLTDNDNNWQLSEHSTNKDNAALDAHFAMEFVYDYFNTKHHRNSWDNAGSPMTSVVHFDSAYDNAFWDGKLHNVYFGDGGNIHDVLTCFDIVAHEFGHAYTQGIDTANPILTNEFNHESLALNEGFGDIWGAAVSIYANLPGKQVWLHGHDAMIDGYACDRSLSDPGAGGDLRETSTGGFPSVYHGQYWDDGGERHTNSTVLSHWFYLITVGDKTKRIPALGLDDAAYIAWQTELLYLSPASTYMDVYTYTTKIAVDHWGVNSCQAIAVANAWNAAGFGERFKNNITGPPAICLSPKQFMLSGSAGTQTVKWQVTPSGSTNVTSGTGDNFLVEQSGNAAGKVTVSAEYCGVVIDSIIVTVGTPKPSLLCNIKDLCYKGPESIAKVCDPFDALQYNWQIDSTDAGVGIELHINTFNLTEGQHTIRVRANGCNGEEFSDWLTGSFKVTNCAAGQTIFIVSPNPASQYLNVSILTADTYTGAKTVRIYDALGRLRREVHFTAPQQDARVYIGNLAQGLYFVEVSDGSKTVRKKVVVGR